MKQLPIEQVAGCTEYYKTDNRKEDVARER